MSCNTCAKSFSLFNKERGCNQCGFSFCSNCLKNKILVPKLEKVSNVCGPCYRSLSKPTDQPARPPTPPAALQRRMEALEQLPDQHPIKVYREDEMSKLKRGMSREDVALADRLQRLQRKRSSATEDEMAERLAKLKGMDPNIATKREPYAKPDLRGDTEKADDLYAQLTAQVELEKKMPKPEDEIAERLAKLKGIDPKTVKSKPESVEPEEFLKRLPKEEKKGDVEEEENDEKDAMKLVKQLSKEFPLLMRKKKTGPEDPDKSSSEDDDEAADQVIERVLGELTPEDHTPISEEVSTEYPWCIICSEDATVRCGECDNELFCSACFRDCHKEEDLADHKGTSYTKKD